MSDKQRGCIMEAKNFRRYVVREVENLQSLRGGKPIWARSHAHAKNLATRSRVFQGTLLRLENEHGVLLYVKEVGKWREVDDFPEFRELGYGSE
jgi:hypothetical protein